MDKRSNMSKKIIATILAVLLSTTIASVLFGCGGSSKGAGAIKDITTSEQKSGVVTYTNFQVVLNSDVNWSALSDSDRQAIIDYTVDECRRQAKEMQANNINILGITESGETLFFYDRVNEEMIIYSNGELVGRLPVTPAPE